MGLDQWFSFVRDYRETPLKDNHNFWSIEGKDGNTQYFRKHFALDNYIVEHLNDKKVDPNVEDIALTFKQVKELRSKIVGSLGVLNEVLMCKWSEQERDAKLKDIGYYNDFYKDYWNDFVDRDDSIVVFYEDLKQEASVLNAVISYETTCGTKDDDVVLYYSTFA